MSDPSGMIAQPLPTLTRRAGKRAPVQAMLDLAQQHDIQAFVIGLPLALSGEETAWTAEVRSFGSKIAERSGKPVYYVDERMTSVRAEKTIRSLGLKKSERERKDRIDAAAAMLILQSWLDQPRA
jgi:putative Holliday junction resolvase